MVGSLETPSLVVSFVDWNLIYAVEIVLKEIVEVFCSYLTSQELLLWLVLAIVLWTLFEVKNYYCCWYHSLHYWLYQLLFN